MRNGIRSAGLTWMAALGLPLGVGCAARAEDSAPPGIRELEVRAEDFRFRAPDTVAEGLTRIRLVNQGHEQHHLQLLRLEDGHTAEEVLEDARRGELVTSGTTYVGGPSIPAPGSASEVTVDLEPGQYLMVCYMSSRGVQHLLLGMARRLVVVPSPARPTIPPKADAQLTLDSYSFGLTSALRAGRQIVRVENVAEQPHEVGFVRVSPGHSAAEVLQWLKDESGPPPFAPAGGSMMLSQGGVSFVTLDLEPGEYVLLCFVPDAEDDQPHVAHGMVRAIRIP